MSQPPRIRLLVFSTLVAAVGVSTYAVWRYPTPISSTWFAAFATLLALAVVTVLLAVQTSERGSYTSMDFVPQLGAILLLGPAGAIAVTILSWLLFQFVLLHKQSYKALFNISQVVLAVASASLVYIWFGGSPSLTALPFQESFPPFMIAVLTYFAINTSAVSIAVMVSEGSSFTEAWRSVSLGIIVFDIAMSPLAVLVAVLFIRWGAFALLLALIPLIGLRYSYGINIQLAHLNRDLLRLMVKTIEAQDPYTSGHSIRVAERAKTIAQALRLKSKDVRNIETAALLHDIGKIDIAYGEILRQKGPLTPEQRELIRAHPDKGVDIIRSIRSIDPDVLAAVRHHHERYDSEGYPSGIGGQDIPIGARIVMVCDTIDAMMTARPYRDALPASVVREELLRHKGTQFDPQIIDVVIAEGFLDSLDLSSARQTHNRPPTAVSLPEPRQSTV
jgi:putative nucleotidyltransferase with HDIG domain